MTKIIMHGCNGHMGQVITAICAADEACEIVAGIDIVDNRENGYPVFTDIDACDVEHALTIAKRLAKPEDYILCFGSLSFLGDVYRYSVE